MRDEKEGIDAMASFSGFHDAVKRVTNVAALTEKEEVKDVVPPLNLKGFKDVDIKKRFKPKPMKDQESEEEVQNEASSDSKMKNRFHKVAKKVVHTNAIRDVNYRNGRQSRVFTATKNKSSVKKVPIVGGTPITYDTVLELRSLVFGNPQLFGFAESEWFGHSFGFHEPQSPNGFSLIVPRVANKGVIMCVQGYVLKHLLFSRRSSRIIGEPELFLRATVKSQEDALVAAICDILWKAGDRQRAVLCLAQELSYVLDSQTYYSDGCTEKLHFFEYKKQEELAFNLRKYLYEFICGENGLLLLVYSLVMTRGFQQMYKDLGEERPSLIQANGSVHQCLITLMLTGAATRYLHNGIVYEGDENTMARPKVGILNRVDVGLLVWKHQSDGYLDTVGSRLKTPFLPIWITVCNGSFGILFSLKRDLLRDYHAEHRFDLNYYSNNSNQNTYATITIDTRSHCVRDEYHVPPLENVIHTKWQDAEIIWNGSAPHV